MPKELQIVINITKTNRGLRGSHCQWEDNRLKIILTAKPLPACIIKD